MLESVAQVGFRPMRLWAPGRGRGPWAKLRPPWGTSGHSPLLRSPQSCPGSASLQLMLRPPRQARRSPQRTAHNTHFTGQHSAPCGTASRSLPLRFPPLPLAPPAAIPTTPPPSQAPPAARPPRHPPLRPWPRSRPPPQPPPRPPSPSAPRAQPPAPPLSPPPLAPPTPPTPPPVFAPALELPTSAAPRARAQTSAHGRRAFGRARGRAPREAAGGEAGGAPCAHATRASRKQLAEARAGQ